MRKSFSVAIAPLLAASTAAATLVLVLMLVQAIGITAGRQVEADIGQGLAELAYQTTDKLDRGMYERYREVQLMAERYEITEKSVPVPAKRAVLNSMQETYPAYAWIGMTDTAGKVLVATKGMLEGANVSQRPWYVAAYRDEHLSDVHEAVLLAKLLSNPTNEPKRFFDVAFPYRDKDGEIAGILGAHLSWQWAKEVEDSVLRPLAKRKGVETFILSRHGRVLLGPDGYRDMDLQLDSIARSKVARNGFVTETWADGKRYLVGYSQSHGFRSYPGMGWTVLVRQNLDVAYEPVNQLKRKILWGGALVAMLVSTLLWIIARRVTSPLRAITRHANALRQGVMQTIPAIGSRLAEVHILEDALNTMLDELRSKEAGLRHMNATLEDQVQRRTEDLHRSVEETRLGERRVRAIIDTALDAFIGVDDKGIITDWNPRAHEIFGWTREEAVGRSVSDTIIPAHLRNAHERGMERFSVSGSSGVVGKRLQLVAQRRDGEVFPVEMTIGLIDAGDDHFFGAFIQDISERKRIEDELARERELLDVVLDSIDVGVAVCSQAGEITMFNRAARKLHGFPAEQIPVEQWSNHYSLYAADGVTPLAPHEIPLVRALSGEIVKNAEMTVKSKDGRHRFLFASGRALHARDGAGIGAVIAMKDVTDLKESERRLETNERLLRTIADNLPVLIAYIDSDERYQFANATYETWFGIPSKQMIGKTVREVLGPTLYEEGKAPLRANLAGEAVRFQSAAPGADGMRYLEVVGIPDTKDGVTRGVYLLTSDITEAKRHGEELSRLARVDPLTGLPNRRSYEERLQESLQRADRSGRGLALMFLDVDHFKRINDTFGHAGGDLVLQEFGRRLKASVRATDIVSRLAGDEFTIVLEGLNDAAEAALVAGKIIDAFETPVDLGTTHYRMSTSIGIAFTRGRRIDGPALSHEADRALYEAKGDGRGRFAIFKPDGAADVQRSRPAA